MRLATGLFALSLATVGSLGCAAHTKLTPSQGEWPSYKGTSGEKTSVAAIKQEIKDGQFEHAGRLLETVAAETNQEQIEVHFYRGVVLQSQNRLEASLEEFCACRDLIRPDTDRDLQMDIHRQLADAYREVHDYKSAASCLRACAELRGDDSLRDEITFLTEFTGTPYEITLPGATTTVEMESYRGLPRIEGRVNDAVDVKFIVDTGAQ